jgi:hypothetical protein
LIRGPRRARIAGSRVRAAKTAAPTATIPATPRERSSWNWKATNPVRPISTVPAEKKTARPAVASAVSRACAVPVPSRRSSSRKRLTMKRA